MGDMSAEPSMEDILASIKRVIREGEPQTPPRRMSPPRAVPEPLPPRDEEEEVLELSQPIPAAPVSSPAPPIEAEPEPSPPVRRVASTVAPTRAAPTYLATNHPAPSHAAEPEDAPGVSPATAEAARGALDQLSRLVVRPEPSGGDGTLEGLVRDMLRPMLSEWLDANLPRLVEEMVAREIAKITHGGR
jgi:cell pole-organizing protein PopZ